MVNITFFTHPHGVLPKQAQCIFTLTTDESWKLFSGIPSWWTYAYGIFIISGI